MGRHRRRAGAGLSGTTRIMNALRSFVHALSSPKIHKHQVQAAAQIDQAASVVEQQKRETDLLAEQVWKAMGGHD